jgi:hypothetical protein
MASHEALTGAVKHTPNAGKGLLDEHKRAIRQLAELYDATERPLEAEKLRAMLEK